MRTPSLVIFGLCWWLKRSRPPCVRWTLASHRKSVRRVASEDLNGLLDQHSVVDWLPQDRPQRQFFRTRNVEGSDVNHLDVWLPDARHATQRDAVDATWHNEVGNQQSDRRLSLQDLQCGIEVGCHGDLESGAPEQFAGRFGKQRLVIDHQNMTASHDSAPPEEARSGEQT